MYYFKPMMPFASKFIHAETEWLMTREARTLIAKSIIHCRKFHGRAEAKAFHNYLVYLGVIYPQLLGKTLTRYEELS